MQIEMNRDVINENGTERKVIILVSVLVLMWSVTTGFKLWGYELFKSHMDLQPLAPFIKDLLKIALPFAELSVAVLLVCPRTYLYGLYLSLGLLTLFCGYIGFLYLTQPKLPCACGGPISGLKWWQHLLFNLSFIAIAVWSVYLSLKRKEEAMSP